MRAIMNGRIIKGPFRVLLFLIIISFFGANWRHQCEAGTLITAIADSGSVSNERNNMTNNNPISISPPENKTTTLVLSPLTHATGVVQPQPAERAGGVVVKDIIVVEEDNISIAQRSAPPEPEPCPIETHSERMEDSEIGKQKEEGSTTGSGSNLQNGNDKSSTTGPGSSPPVKEEKVETALEKISESISGVITTIKNSVASIFSPGHGIQQSGRMDCFNHSTTGPDVNEKGNSSTNSTTDESLTKPHTLKEGEEVLPHPISLNESENNNATNSSSTSTSTTTIHPLNITEAV